MKCRFGIENIWESKFWIDTFLRLETLPRDSVQGSKPLEQIFLPERNLSLEWENVFCSWTGEWDIFSRVVFQNKIKYSTYTKQGEVDSRIWIILITIVVRCTSLYINIFFHQMFIPNSSQHMTIVCLISLLKICSPGNFLLLNHYSILLWAFSVTCSHCSDGRLPHCWTYTAVKWCQFLGIVFMKMTLISLTTYIL